jgi:hypothetical protein
VISDVEVRLVVLQRDGAFFECTQCDTVEALSIAVAREHLLHLSLREQVLLRGQLENHVRDAGVLDAAVLRTVESVRIWHATQEPSVEARAVLAELAGIRSEHLPVGRELRAVYALAAQRRTGLRLRPRAGNASPGTTELTDDVAVENAGSSEDQRMPPTDATKGLVERLLASDIYREQHEMAGRQAPPETLLRSVLAAAVVGRGRLTWTAFEDLCESIAAPDQAVALLRRLLNVEGYDVFTADRGAGTVTLDLELLKDQFEI